MKEGLAAERLIKKSGIRGKNKEYIPDFTNVYVGQQWHGAHRRAAFIKALGIVPAKSTSSSRAAQEKSILRYCSYEDNKQMKVITLIDIYDEQLPKSRKARALKYEPLIRTVLLYHLLTNDTLHTTKRGFFKKLGIISKTYKEIPNSFYNMKILQEQRGKGFRIEQTVNRIRDIADERFADIVTSALVKMQADKIIYYESTPVIVTKSEQGEKHIQLQNVGELNLSVSEAKEMLGQAENYALSELRKDIYDIKELKDVVKYYKFGEYSEYFNDFIREKYGWLYVYHEIEIRIALEKNNLREKILPLSEHEAKELLAQLIVKALYDTITKKYYNREKVYQQEYDRLSHYYQDNEDLRELTEYGVYTEKDIRKNVCKYHYPEGFLAVRDIFIKYEIEHNADAQRDIEEWKQNNKERKRN